MRLLFLIHGYPPDVVGGHEVRCQRTAEGLRQRGSRCFGAHNLQARKRTTKGRVRLETPALQMVGRPKKVSIQMGLCLSAQCQGLPASPQRIPTRYHLPMEL
jgi:hypothetical protein